MIGPKVFIEKPNVFRVFCQLLISGSIFLILAALTVDIKQNPAENIMLDPESMRAASSTLLVSWRDIRTASIDPLKAM